MIITDVGILRRSNSKVEENEVPELLRLLEQELANSSTSGVGLAAPQIGINKTIAIVRSGKDCYNLVNPVILDQSQGFVNKGEGCLSLPGERVNTYRYKEIFLKDDLHPEGYVIVGFPAIVVQHECDHLEGILIIDRAVGKNKVGRNDPCPCCSGKKFKKCHGR